MSASSIVVFIVVLLGSPTFAFAGPPCTTTAACPETDVNCDNVTDGFDVAVVRAPGNWLMSRVDADDPRADVNGDGIIDGFDVAAIRSPACWLQSGVTATQLAGESLSAYPHFEYVRAFNAGRPVEIAIDPTRFPEIAGLTCDVYVVTARTQAEWDADASLVDVRAGGAQTVTFGAATIQDNTITVDTGTLDADAGTRFGVGYDVVLDCDQDAELSGGDFIDGRGDESGFYVVHDTTQLGPLATASITYSGGAFLGQRTWYPTDIATRGELPLVVISHGAGHQYTWYDYLQEHLASYGYIVMSHQNNVGPGVETASTTTLANTDYFLGSLETIGGGVFAGHVDARRIAWIGHSRGGEGVARAYDRLYDGESTPNNYALEDIRLVSSIAPTDTLGPAGANAHTGNYHLLYGAADGDVSGAPFGDPANSFNLYERAAGYRQSTYVHGADHNDFNCCGFDDFDGPPGTAIGRSEAQRVAKGAYLALVNHYFEGNIPAKDFLWRQYERIRPIGVADTTVVVQDYKEGAGDNGAAIDDFQRSSALGVSSSGGAVTFDVQNPVEGLLNDGDSSFAWTPDDPMNGMTRARTNDLTKGLVFDWSTGTDRFIEFAVAAGLRDFSRYEYLSFRACQGTRHPETIAELGDLTFTVTLRDTTGNDSSIDLGAYGGGIEEPYQRTGAGDGAGWQNEFESIRIRLTDFLHNGSEVDLTHVAAVRLDFGESFGAGGGRIGLDDLYLSRDLARPSLTLRLPNGAPQFLPPGRTTTMTVKITVPDDETLVDGSPTLHYRFDGGAFLTTPLAVVGGDLYEATMPAPSCPDLPEFYVSAEGSVSGVVTEPPEAPTVPFTAPVGEFVAFYAEHFDSDPGWTMEGLWAFGQPTGGGGQFGGPDPTSGFSGTNVYGYNLAGDYENNLPQRHLSSTPIVTTGKFGVTLTFRRWLGVDVPVSDHAFIYISIDGFTWFRVWENGGEFTDTQWVETRFDLSTWADNRPAIRLRWTMGPTDGARQYCGWNIDDVELSTFECIDP